MTRLLRACVLFVLPAAVAVTAFLVAGGQKDALPVQAAGPTAVCGTLANSTWNLAGSPYQICAGGATIPAGVTVTLDGSGGPVTVQAQGTGGLTVAGTLASGVTVANFTFTGPTSTAGSWSGINLTTGGVINVSSVTISYGQYGINASSGTSVTMTGGGINNTLYDGITDYATPLTLSSLMISSAGATGITVSSAAMSLTSVSVMTAVGDGVHFSDGTLTKAVSITSSAIQSAGGYGIYVYGGLADPTISNNTITNSGLTGNKSAAISLPAYTGDLAAHVNGDHGSGNGLDAIGVAGTITNDATWVSPTNSAVDHALGYLAIGTINLSPNKKLTVPQGSVVKFLNGYLNINGGTLDATDVSGPNGAKFFTTFRDSSVGPTTCPTVYVSTTCGVIGNDWNGIQFNLDNGTGAKGNGAFANTTIHYVSGNAIYISSGATTNPSTNAGYGLSLTNTTLDTTAYDALSASTTPVFVSGGTISHSGGRAIYISSAALSVTGLTVNTTGGEGIYFSEGTLTHPVSITGSTITGATGYGIYVYGGSPNPVITNNTVTGSGNSSIKYPAIDMPYYNGDIATNVSGNHGSGNGLDAIGVAGTITANATWLNPTNSGTDHPFGYLAVGTVNMSPNTALTVPQGTVVKFLNGYLNLNGADLIATDVSGADNQKIFTSFRDPVGIQTCPTVFVSTTCGTLTEDWSGIQITQDTGSGRRGSASLVNSIVRLTSSSALAISSGATTNPSGLPGYGLTLSNVGLDTTGTDALSATSTPMSVVNSQISNATGRGIYASGGNVAISGTSVTNATGEGIYFSDGAGTHTFSATTSNINNAGTYGIYVYGGAANPLISTNSIVGSGHGNSTLYSAIDLPFYTGDLQGNVVGNHGSGNGLDVISVAGTITADLLWVSPSNSATDHPFGYIAIGTLNINPGKKLTLKQGALVKIQSGYINLNGAILDATDITAPNNPKVFTTFRDPAGIPTCPSIFVSTTCLILSNDWYGLAINLDNTSGLKGNAAFNNTTIHYVSGTGINISSGATTNPSAITGFGVVLVNSTVDSVSSDGIDTSSTPLYVGGSTISNTGQRGIYGVSSNVTVTGTNLHGVTTDGIYVSESTRTATFTLTNNTISGAGGYGIYAYGGAPASLFSGNGITTSGLTGNKSSAIALQYFLGDLGAATAGNHGSGNGLDAVAVAGTITNNLTWLSPTNSGADHAFGFLGIGTLNFNSGTKLTLQQGAVVKMTFGYINLLGASLDATDTSGPNTPKVFTSFRDGSVGPPTCPTVFVSTTCGVITNDWYGITITQDTTSGLRGSAAFNNTTIHYASGNAINITSGATSNPAGVGSYGLVLMNSNLGNTSSDALSASGTSVDVTGTTFDTAAGNGAYISGGANTFANDLFQNITGSGLVNAGTSTMTVVASRFHNIGGTSTSFFALVGSSNGALTVDCSSVHDNAGGFQSNTSGNAINDSDLFHNSGTGRYDLFASSTTNAQKNWWGQSGGPVAGQTGGAGALDSGSPISAQTPTVTVQLATGNANANGTVGSGLLTVTLVFNRKMDPTVAPTAVVNPGAHAVTAIGSGTGWQPDGVTWIGKVTVDVNFTNGANTVDVSAARSCVPEPTTNQMSPSSTGFNVDATGTAATTTTPATNVHDTGATFNGTINPNGWTATGHFDYGTTSGVYTNSTPTQAVGNGTSAAPITAAVTGLTPFTTYYYRAVGVVSNGTTYGTEQTFVTPSILHFPALMNNAYGGYTTTVYLQNKSGSALGAGAITITYFDTAGNPVGTGDSSPALANGAVWVVPQTNGHSFASGGAGSGRVNTSVPVVAFVNQEITGQDGSSYSALPDPATGSTVFTPAVMNAAYGGFTTGMGITNTGTASTTVTVTYHNPDGSDVATTRTQVLAPNAYWGLYQGETGTPLPLGFHGTATISSSPAQNLAVIVNEVGPGGFLTYSASNAGATTLYAPVVFNSAYGGYNTGMGIMNVTSSTAHVTITYTGGASESFTLAPHGFAGDYNGPGNGAGLPAGFAGSAVVTSDQLLVAIVNEVIGIQGTSYNMVAAGVPTIHLPLVENTLNGFSTGFGVENVGSGSATITVAYFDANTGAPIGTPYTLTLAPGAFVGVYDGPGGDAQVPAGTRATATLTVTNPGGGGKLAVIVNQQSPTSFMSYSGQ